MNGDQHLDIVTVEKNAHSFSVRLGVGNGTFGPRLITTGPFSDPLAMAVGHFDGDVHLDIALTHLSPHAFSVFLGHGDGTFGSPVTYTTSSAPSGGIASADLDGDAKLDVVAAAGTQLWIYRGNGDGSFTFSSIVFASSLGLGGVGIDDLSGDQKPDLAVAVGEGLAIWLGNGDATFGPRATYPTPNNVVNSVTMRDFNGDGFKDVAVASAGLTVFSGYGDGTFAAYANFKAASGNVNTSSGDLDEDGRPDVAVGCGAGQVVSVFLNKTTVVDSHRSKSSTDLAQSHPNPTNGGATIGFSLLEPGQATLRIYDVAGHVVQTLLHQDMSAGWHAVQWDRRRSHGGLTSAGIYFYELQTSQGRFIKRMTLLKP